MDAISQLTGAVEEKLSEEGEGEDVKAHLKECRLKWQDLGKKCK